MYDSLIHTRVKVGLSLGLVLVTALGLRLYLLGTPQTELEADEAIVGLMARHILEGERPVFYYMQPYLGSLEAYLAAGIFALLGSSAFALKLVPLIATLLFVALVFATAYRLGGLAPAFIAGMYVAVPPAFFALWSLKARGGYIETLVIGQLLLLLALSIEKKGSVGWLPGIALGFLAGLGLWTNPLVGVYLLPVAGYLLLSLRTSLLGWWIFPSTMAALVGVYPLLEYNLQHGFATADAMFGGTGSISEAPHYLNQFFHYSLMILAGLTQASSSPEFFGPAFSTSLGSSLEVMAAVSGLFLLLVLAQARPMAGLISGKRAWDGGRSLLGLLLIVVPAAFLLSKFRDLTTEPRYLLPLYSGVPLLGLALTSGPRLWRCAAPLLVAALLALNLYSISSLDPLLNLPDTAVGSTTSNRAELTRFLLDHGLDRVYADYWIAYPLALDSQERVVPSVTTGGFNRYIPYAYLVSTAPNPAFVFIAGSKEEQAFTAKLAEQQARAAKEQLSIYSVYWRVEPLAPMRW